MRTLEQRSGEYWIVSDDPQDIAAGPYDNRKEAEADRLGLNRFDREFAKQFPGVEPEIAPGLLF